MNLPEGPRPVSRRSFLKASALAAGTVAFPTIVPASVFGPSAPSKRINMATIGTGGRGVGDMNGFMGYPDVRMVAVCDVDRNRLERAQKTVNTRYGDASCAAFGDFRELLARDDIDAVVIGTPENWHSLLTIAAAKAGKDIYCEKPFAPTIAEGRAAADAVRKYGRILQVGSQERSRALGRYACELARNGRLGRIHTIRVNLPVDPHPSPPMDVQPVPEGLDYDLWLGPAPWAPYTPRRCHGSFRWILDYSDGELTDRGCHVGDLAIWGGGFDRSGPVEIEGRAEFPPDGLYSTPFGYEIQAKFAGGVKMTIKDGGDRGVKFEGDDGWVFYHVHGGTLDASDDRLIREPIRPGELHLYNATNDHYRNFLNCIRSRKETIAPAEAGHRTSSLCHLATIACITGRRLQWDPAAERFTNDAAANNMIGRAMRSPWNLS